ncbi:hypothetical protein FOA52_010781 [Chlamydomonas sp. UWO 241]|nr:hypothetical protein FOA52_010781 [Chlamydomonas sp. UWO 241]
MITALGSTSTAGDERTAGGQRTGSGEAARAEDTATRAAITALPHPTGSAATPQRAAPGTSSAGIAPAGPAAASGIGEEGDADGEGAATGTAGITPSLALVLYQDEPLAPPSGYDEGMQGGEGMSALARQHAAMHEVAMRQADAMRADARRNHAATETRLSGLETALGGLGSGYGRMNAEVIRLGLGLTAMEERTAGHEALVREDTKARQVQYIRDLASRASKDELGAHAAAQQRDTAALRDEIRQAAGMGPTGNVRAAIIAERRETRCNRMFKVIIPQRVTDRPLELADKLHTWLIRPELLGKPPPAAGPLVFEDAWVLRPKGGETSSQEGTKAAFVVASPLLARWVHSRLAAVSAAGVSISVERTPAQQQAWLPLKALFAQAMQEGRKVRSARGCLWVDDKQVLAGGVLPPREPAQQGGGEYPPPPPPGAQHAGGGQPVDTGPDMGQLPGAALRGRPGRGTTGDRH